MHGVGDFAEVFLEGNAGMHVYSGAVSMVAGYYGANKLIKADSALDRLEGIGNLALAGHCALEATGHGALGINAGLSILHAGSELFLGVADIANGKKNHCNRRLAAGICQLMVGVGSLASQFVPGGQLIGASMILAGTIGRQVAIALPAKIEA